MQSRRIRTTTLIQEFISLSLINLLMGKLSQTYKRKGRKLLFLESGLNWFVIHSVIGTDTNGISNRVNVMNVNKINLLLLQVGLVVQTFLSRPAKRNIHSSCSCIVDIASTSTGLKQVITSLSVQKSL